MFPEKAWQVAPKGGLLQLKGSMIRYGAWPVLGSGWLRRAEKSPFNIAGVGT
jgi:hypothetical protein